MAQTTDDDGTSVAGGRRLVRGYIDGCFDIMHSGHYNAIRQAKALCDVLVVGVHSDACIGENKSMPVMRQAERYALLEHIKWVDEILHDVPYSPELATLELAHADFCVHGDDMPVNSQGICAYQEMKDADRLRIIKRTEGISTTDLIGRLLTLSRHQHQPEQRGLPSEGIRVPVSAVDYSASCERTAATSPVLDTVLGIVDDLAARYALAEADVERLRAHIALVAATSSGPAAAGAGCAGDADVAAAAAKRPRLEATQQVRTKVPVQLLTSTRRISEFSSARQPAQGDRIVYVSGSFDMFHVGHADFLREARELGTFLFVGIQDDRVVSMAKGASYPVMTLNERVLNVCACRWVDEVIIGAPKTVTLDLVKTWNIDVVARGSGHQRDEALRPGGDDYDVPKSLGIYREVPSRWPHLCHDTVVQRIISEREVYLRRNRDRAAREDAYYLGKDPGASPLEV